MQNDKLRFLLRLSNVLFQCKYIFLKELSKKKIVKRELCFFCIFKRMRTKKMQ